MDPLTGRSSRAADLAWKAMAGLALLDLVLVGLAVAGRDSPLRQPGGSGYVAWAAVPLILGGLAFVGLPAIPAASVQRARQTGTGAGLAAGVLLTAHLGLEDFGNHVGENTAVTLTFMLAAFLIWGAAGYRAARSTGGLGTGPVAGCCGALVGVLLTVTAGLLLMMANVPDPSYVAIWPEFQHSGWTNPRAFAIANSFDAVPGHFGVGLLAGAVFGLLGGGLAQLTRRGSTDPIEH